MVMGLGSRATKDRTAATARPGVYAALDIGTSKIVCFIARVEAARNGERPAVRVVGIGHQLSRGVRGGAIVDMERAEEAVRAAVEAAERMADTTIHQVFVTLSCGQPVSRTERAEVAVQGQEVTEQDIRRVRTAAQQQGEPVDRDVIHTIPLGYSVDGATRIRDPRGMFGERLGAAVHFVSVNPGPLQNLELCIERCHLDVAGRVVSGYASGLACLVSDEMELGATVVDMGGGTTSIAVFLEGNLVHSDVVAVGGNHITTDIARGLSTSVANAERMKTLYGSALPSPADDREMIAAPTIGEDENESVNKVPRASLNGIISPRLEETLELVRDRLDASGFGERVGRRLVLTGGASQLTGLREYAGRVLNRQVRLGRPIRLQGLAEATGGAPFSACAGLLAFAQSGAFEPASEAALDRASRARFGRLGAWLKENLL